MPSPSPLARLQNAAQWLAVTALVSIVAAFAWQWGKSVLQRDAYRARLAETETRYNALVSDYNQAVARTSVCVVRSAGGKLTAILRTADGRTEEHPLPYDPSGAIHFDFVCLSNHLLMRRVYDENTAPGRGTLVAPRLAQVDWSKHADDRGLSVYRPVPEGRYAVKVSGNGALTLEKMTAEEEAQLSAEPTLRRFETAAPMKASDAEPGAWEILRAMWR